MDITDEVFVRHISDDPDAIEPDVIIDPDDSSEYEPSTFFIDFDHAKDVINNDFMDIMSALESLSCVHDPSKNTHVK